MYLLNHPPHPYTFTHRGSKGKRRPKPQQKAKREIRRTGGATREGRTSWPKFPRFPQCKFIRPRIFPHEANCETILELLSLSLSRLLCYALGGCVATPGLGMLCDGWEEETGRGLCPPPHPDRWRYPSI